MFDILVGEKKTQMMNWFWMHHYMHGLTIPFASRLVDRKHSHGNDTQAFIKSQLKKVCYIANNIN